MILVGAVAFAAGLVAGVFGGFALFVGWMLRWATNG